MRAARLFERFRGWRWAPLVALVAGALAFVALALLVIPIQFDAPENVAAAPSPSPSALVARVERTFSPASPARAPGGARELPKAPPATPTAPVPNVARPVPSAAESASASAVGQPDFSANIAARGDRPAAPARELNVH